MHHEQIFEIEALTDSSRGRDLAGRTKYRAMTIKVSAASLTTAGSWEKMRGMEDRKLKMSSIIPRPMAVPIWTTLKSTSLATALLPCSHAQPGESQRQPSLAVSAGMCSMETQKHETEETTNYPVQHSGKPCIQLPAPDTAPDNPLQTLHRHGMLLSCAHVNYFPPGGRTWKTCCDVTADGSAIKYSQHTDD